SLRPLLDGGDGTYALFFEAGGGSAHLNATKIRIDDIPGLRPRSLEALYSAFPPNTVASLYFDSSPCSTASVDLGHLLPDDPTWRAHMASFPFVQDCIALRVNSDSVRGARFGAPLRRRWRVPRPQRQLLERVAAHAGAALRLRRRLAQAAFSGEREQE